MTPRPRRGQAYSFKTARRWRHLGHKQGTGGTRPWGPWREAPNLQPCLSFSVHTLNDRHLAQARGGNQLVIPPCGQVEARPRPDKFGLTRMDAPVRACTTSGDDAEAAGEKRHVTSLEASGRPNVLGNAVRWSVCWHELVRAATHMH